MSFTAIASLLVGPIAELLGKVIPDKDKAAELAQEIATLAEKQSHEVVMAQIEVNKAEAQNPSLFVSGWRPFVGWVCGIGLANNLLLLPYAAAMGMNIQQFDPALITPILGGLLGLGSWLRTREKEQGVARMR